MVWMARRLVVATEQNEKPGRTLLAGLLRLRFQCLKPIQRGSERYVWCVRTQELRTSTFVHFCTQVLETQVHKQSWPLLGVS